MRQILFLDPIWPKGFLCEVAIAPRSPNLPQSLIMVSFWAICKLFKVRCEVVALGVVGDWLKF